MIINGWKDKSNINLIKYGKEHKDNLATFKKWSKYMKEEMPVLFLISPNDVQIVHNRVKNIRPDPRGVLWNIHELELDINIGPKFQLIK